MRKPFILLADDDADDLDLFEDAILGIEPGARVNKISTGKGVINFLKDCTIDQLPHLIILDYNMPEMNGADVLQQLNLVEDYRSIPKVILSTSNAEAHVKHCIECGAVEYFVKPGNYQDLKNVTQRMLQLRSPAE